MQLSREVVEKVSMQDKPIPFNHFPDPDTRPSKKTVSRFWKTLIDAGFIVTVRATRGDDIDAGLWAVGGSRS